MMGFWSVRESVEAAPEREADGAIGEERAEDGGHRRELPALVRSGRGDVSGGPRDMGVLVSPTGDLLG